MKVRNVNGAGTPIVTFYIKILSFSFRSLQHRSFFAPETLICFLMVVWFIKADEQPDTEGKQRENKGKDGDLFGKIDRWRC